MPEAMILEMLRGKEAGGLVTEVTVPASGAVLGRGLDCDIIFNEPTLSRKHCRFACENGKWVVQDLGSHSGVIINGQKANRSPLKQGDEIILGRFCLKVLSVPVPRLVASPGTIRFTCKCGKIHVVAAASAGKTAVCKRCGAKTKVPLAPTRESDAASETAAQAPPSGRPSGPDEIKGVAVSDIPLASKTQTGSPSSPPAGAAPAAASPPATQEWITQYLDILGAIAKRSNVAELRKQMDEVELRHAEAQRTSPAFFDLLDDHEIPINGIFANPELRKGLLYLLTSRRFLIIEEDDDYKGLKVLRSIPLSTIRHVSQKQMIYLKDMHKDQTTLMVGTAVALLNGMATCGILGGAGITVQLADHKTMFEYFDIECVAEGKIDRERILLLCKSRNWEEMRNQGRWRRVWDFYNRLYGIIHLKQINGFRVTEALHAAAVWERQTGRVIEDRLSEEEERRHLGDRSACTVVEGGKQVGHSAKGKLAELKRLLDEGLISQAEYDGKRKKVLDAL